MSRSPNRHLVAALLLLVAGAGSSTVVAMSMWEYQVVLIQGMTAGGKLEKQMSGVFVDTKKTQILNELAAEGWEIVSVIGASAADHVVYLRRAKAR